jgi:hypothetical protein
MLSLSYNSPEIIKLKQFFKIDKMSFYRNYSYDILEKGNKWYHASTLENLESILTKGLIPSFNKRYSVSETGKLYITQNPNVLLTHSSYDGVVFEFDLLDASLLDYDVNVKKLTNDDNELKKSTINIEYIVIMVEYRKGLSLLSI